MTHPRHAELVSASMVQQAAASPVEAWTLKQVQGDGGGSGGGAEAAGDQPGGERGVKVVYPLWHVPEGDEYREQAKLIGIYALASDAKAAVERLKRQPGFVDYPQGFEFDAYEMGKDQWTEGFGFVED